MYFTVGGVQGGGYSWWLYGANHKMVAWAGETFPSQFNAQRACAAFKIGARTATFEVYPDGASNYRWRAWRSSDKVAASGEAFDSKGNAQRAADNVQGNAGTATGP